MGKERDHAFLELDIVKAYVQSLSLFIEEFPELEKKLKADLAAKDYARCSADMLAICDRLRKIHADDLAEKYLQRIDGLESVEHDKIEADVIDFLAHVSMLSIDIQVALHRNKDALHEAQDGDASKTEKSKGGTILAVDDVSLFLRTLKMALDETPHQVVYVTSGAAALRFLEEHRPDLFLLDIEMPGMDGYTLARKIRAMGQKAPIIFLTGNSEKKYVLQAIEAGAADFIIKPLDKELLFKKIDKFINM